MCYDVQNFIIMKKFEFKPCIDGKPVPQIIIAIYNASLCKEDKEPSDMDVLAFAEKHKKTIKAEAVNLSRLDFQDMNLFEKINPEDVVAFCERTKAAQDFWERIRNKVFPIKRARSRRSLKIAS